MDRVSVISPVVHEHHRTASRRLIGSLLPSIAGEAPRTSARPLFLRKDYPPALGWQRIVFSGIGTATALSGTGFFRVSSVPARLVGEQARIRVVLVLVLVRSPKVPPRSHERVACVLSHEATVREVHVLGDASFLPPPHLGPWQRPREDLMRGSGSATGEPDLGVRGRLPRLPPSRSRPTCPLPMW